MNKPLAFLVEDDHKLADIFAQALRTANFSVEVARDGQIALERLQAIIPAIIVLDLHLPGVSGREILRQIRRDSRLIKSRVILATADSATAEVLDREVDLTLIKPISFSQLRDLARRLHPTPWQD